MRLEQLYPNFGLATVEEQASYVSAYRLRRAQDMEKPSTYTKHVAKASANALKINTSVTPEEKAVLKALGLKQKDILALRAMMEPAEETDKDEEGAAALLGDGTFDEGEDE